MPRPPDQPPPPPDPSPEAANPDWFREPTPREHNLAAALFIVFGVFFAALFVVLHGWWFRWVILALGVLSVLHGLWHAVEARPAQEKEEGGRPNNGGESQPTSKRKSPV